jgi:hypothetical protein
MSASRHRQVAVADVEEEASEPEHPQRRSTPARAYARSLEHPALDTADERIAYIRELMVSDVWTPETTGVLQEILSARWGLAEPTIRGYSRDASRMIREVARDMGGLYAITALNTLSTVAMKGAGSAIPGDKNAAVNASEKLLKFAGLAEPEEDKQRLTTLVQVGQVVASPVFGALLAGHEPKTLNGKANGTTNGHAEGSDDVPEGGRNGALVRKT